MFFYILGDMGSGNNDQLKVAESMKEHIGNKKTFVCGLGDNIYENGCSSCDDPLFIKQFEEPYKGIADSIPFYMCLGNHDYGYSNQNLDRKKNARSQVLYSDKSKKWKMPNNYYTFSKKDNNVTVDFFVIDTNVDILDLNEIKEQLEYMKNMINKSKADWKIVNGHHTWKSIAGHGNAEENLESFLTELFQEAPFDVYMCGHDHNKQVIDLTIDGNKVNLIVCGTGGKYYDDSINYDNLDQESDLFFSSNNLGYGVCKAKKNKLLFTFLNENNEIEYLYNLVK